MKLHRTKSTILYFVSVAFAGCQQTAGGAESTTKFGLGGACLMLVNGQIDTQNAYEAVVPLTDANNKLCTGTFVSHNTVLTAAHCIDPDQPGGGLKVRIGARRISSKVTITPSSLKPIPLKDDVAVVVFPDQTSSVWMNLSAFSPKPGQRIKLAGFGQTDFLKDNDSDGKRRFGENVISEIAEGGTAIVYDLPVDGSGNPTNAHAMTGRGDSGGPVMIGRGIVGIVSRGPATPVEGKIKGYDNNLFRPDMLAFFGTASEKIGAVFNGIEEMRNAMNGDATGGGGSCQ